MWLVLVNLENIYLNSTMNLVVMTFSQVTVTFKQTDFYTFDIFIILQDLYEPLFKDLILSRCVIAGLQLHWNWKILSLFKLEENWEVYFHSQSNILWFCNITFILDIKGLFTYYVNRWRGGVVGRSGGGVCVFWVIPNFDKKCSRLL